MPRIAMPITAFEGFHEGMDCISLYVEAVENAGKDRGTKKTVQGARMFD